jgi:hypothetical protein
LRPFATLCCSFPKENAVTRMDSRLEAARRLAPSASNADLVGRIAGAIVDELGIARPPVNLHMVASMLGIATVHADPALDVAGCLVCGHDGSFEIRVRATDPARRQRFTIGHECGHTFFPGYASATQYRCSPTVRLSESPDLEALCDVASSELLLPRRLFVPDALGAPFGLPTIEHLAAAYEASLEATGHRLVNTWPEPTALLTLSRRQKPREAGTHAPPRLRLDQANTQGSWPYFLRHKAAIDGDVFDRALQGEVVAELTTITGLTTEPIEAEVHARLYPLSISGDLVPRVIALARQPRR